MFKCELFAHRGFEFECHCRVDYRYVYGAYRFSIRWLAGIALSQIHNRDNNHLVIHHYQFIFHALRVAFSCCG